MSTPTNDVRALYNVLNALWEPPAKSLKEAWADALDCEYESLEFTKRHAEVLSLYRGALAQIAALPDTARQRYEKYAWTWWIALTGPDVSWSQKLNFSDLLPEHTLDQLAGVADLVEARMSGGRIGPSAEKLEELRSACEEWIDVVSSETDLPDQLRAELLLNLRHVIWLVENAKLFGLARVSAAGQTLIGEVATVSERLAPVKRGMWVQWSLKVLRVLIVIGGVHAGVDASLMLGQAGGEVLGDLVAGSTDGTDPMAPGPLELEPGPEPDTKDA